MSNEDRFKLFKEVLSRFEFQSIEGETKPVLITGRVLDLYNMIVQEVENHYEDPNEGDHGSAYDQHPEEFDQEYL